MSENLNKLDQENVVRLRKFKKKTQAKVAGDLGMSLRRYIGFENTSEEVMLSSLELRNFSLALEVHPYMLLGDVPLKFTSHWKKLSAPSTFSEILFKSKGDLQVAGLPYNKKLRTALVEVVELFEEKKLDSLLKVPLLSETLKKRFRCDDLIEQLVGVGAKGIETLATAELYALMVPKLEITKKSRYHDGEWEGHVGHVYEWSQTTDLLLDFDKTAKDQPVTFDLIHGENALDYFRALEDDPEEHAKMVHEALEARPAIPIVDEHIFQTEPYKNPEPTVGEAHTTVKDGSAPESEKDTKEDEEEPD